MQNYLFIGGSQDGLNAPVVPDQKTVSLRQYGIGKNQMRQAALPQGHRISDLRAKLRIGT